MTSSTAVAAVAMSCSEHVFSTVFQEEFLAISYFAEMHFKDFRQHFCVYDVFIFSWKVLKGRPAEKRYLKKLKSSERACAKYDH